MFDVASRENLKECGAFESYLIREILEVQELALGIVLPSKHIITDNSHQVSLGFTEQVGANVAANFSEKLSPLVFASAFKLIDQTFEWILFENGKASKKAFWSFKEKFDCFTNNQLIYPDFLNSDASFQDILKKLYTYLWPRRNALIHSKWGNLSGRDLSFNFSDKDHTQQGSPIVHFQDTVTFNEVIYLADFSQQLFFALIDTQNQNQTRITSLKILSDKLLKFHGCSEFNIKQHLSFIVERITSNDSISIADIREKLKPDSFGHPYSFVLTVKSEKTGQVWETDSERLDGIDSIKLEDLGQYS